MLNVAQLGLFAMLKASVSPSASDAVGRKLYEAPCLTDVAGAPLITGALFAGAVTEIANAGSDVVAFPSLTRMTMFEYEPACEDAGVPLNRPVEVLNVAQLGLFAMLKASVSPFASEAEGWKVYALPATTDVAGAPLITGALFAGAVTEIANAGSDVVAFPSLTRMTMFEYVPTCVVVGVPDTLPVEALNVAQFGLFVMLKVSVSLFASIAVGWNAYATPTVAFVGGVPEIVGAAFELARIENAGSELVLAPSLTLIWMFVQRPTAEGVPYRRPVDVLKLAQLGLFTMLKLSVAPSGSEAVGRNEYCDPTYTNASGAPEMLGGWLAAAATVGPTDAARRTIEASSVGKRRRRATVEQCMAITPQGRARAQQPGSACMHSRALLCLTREVVSGRRAREPRASDAHFTPASASSRPLAWRQPRYP